MHEDLVNLVQHYRMRYPFNKFITLEKLQEICKKYGLIYGPVSRYTGFIPEAKLSEMEKFKFKKEDAPLEFQFGWSWYDEEELKKPWNSFPGSKYLDDQDKYDESLNAGKPMNDHCRYKDSEFLICAPLKNMNISSREQIINYKIVPVVCGSAFKNKGVQLMLDAIVDFLPSPLDVKAVEGENEKGEKVICKPDEKEPFTALVFKVATDPYVGTLSFFRVYSGKLTKGSYVLNSNKNSQERISRILRMFSSKREDIDDITSLTSVDMSGFTSIVE